MNYHTLPGTDLEVSAIGMGCWALAGDATWGPQDQRDALDAVTAALDAGINFFDTAELYGGGVSERLLGRGLGRRRDEAVIASKFSPEHAAPDALVAACDRSLAALDTDRIDLYQIHWPSREVPFDRTWRTLETLQSAGKIRYVGVSNFGVGDLGDLLAIGRPATNQLPYNLLMRAIELEVLPRCVEEEIGVLCYSPLQHGLLTGKFAAASDVPEGRARSRHFSSTRPLTRHGEPGCEAETFAALGRLREIAEGSGRSMAEVSMAWLLAQPGVTSVLCGIRTPAQARQNAAAAAPLLPDTTAALSAATAPVKAALGHNPDMWESAANSRYR